MKLARRLTPLRGQLNIAPLISVVLLLLVYFMLSSRFIVQPGFRVELPQSAFGQPIHSDNLIVSILMQPAKKDQTGKKDAYIFFNDQIVDLPQLQKRLHDLAKDRPSQTLVIKADKDAPYGLIFDVMNLALELNWRVVQATQRVETPIQKPEAKSDDVGS